MTQKSFDGNAVPARLTVGITSVALSFNIDVNTGWPTTPAFPFVLTIGKGTAAEEKVLCTAQAGGTVTVSVRGFDSTTATAHVAGETVEHSVDADTLNDLMRHTFTVTDDDHAQYLRTDGTRALTGTSAIAGAPVASAPGDTASTGAALTLALSDHRHAREAFAAPVASVPGDAQSSGAATSVSRSDHVHARESFGPPASLGPANSAGVSPLVSRADHVHKGGLIIATSTAAVTTPVEGDALAATATDRVEQYSGTAWVRSGWWSAAGRTGCTMERSAVSVTSGAAFVFVWDTETVDTDGFASAGSPNITIPAGLGGLYTISLRGSWTVILANRAGCSILVNSTIYRTVTTGDDFLAGHVAAVPLVPGDVITVNVFHFEPSSRTVSGHIDLYRLGA